MKKDELKAICKKYNIKGYSTKNKAELIEMIKQKDVTQEQKNDAEDQDIKIEPVVKTEITSTTDDILCATYWKNTKKIQVYQRQGNPNQILQKNE